MQQQRNTNLFDCKSHNTFPFIMGSVTTVALPVHDFQYLKKRKNINKLTSIFAFIILFTPIGVFRNDLINIEM